MKRTLLILGGIARFLMLLLLLRALFHQRSSGSDERKWFVKALHYEFSARVDSVLMFNQNSGRLRCLLTTGDPQVDREDSLKRLFKHHDMLCTLIFKRSADSIMFVLPDHASLVAKGDSMRVSSRENRVQFFRAGKPVVTDSLTETLTGFSRPFFMREKRKE